MKQFGCQIGFFVVLLFIVNLLLFNIGNDLYYKNYDSYNLNFNSYLFADSHGVPIKTNTEEYGVYNFSVNSESYRDIQRKINFLIDNTTLDTIYISADEYMLSPYREQLNNLDKSLFYATKKDFPSQLAYYKNKVSQKIIFFQPKMGLVLKKYFITKIESLFTTSKVNKPRVTNTYLESNWSEMPISYKQEKATNRGKDQFFHDKESLLLKTSLLEIINMCKTNGIVLIGVKFPVTKECFTVIKDETFGVESIFKMNNLQVLDFRSSYINNENLFYDVDHLNTKGGKLFAKDLFNNAQGFKND